MSENLYKVTKIIADIQIIVLFYLKNQHINRKLQPPCALPHTLLRLYVSVRQMSSD